MVPAVRDSVRFSYEGITHAVHKTFRASAGDYIFFVCGWIAEVGDEIYLFGAHTHAMTPTHDPPTCLWCVTETERR